MRRRASMPSKNERKRRKQPEQTLLKLLIVDDNRDAAEMMGKLLRILGNDVRVVYDGFMALEEARAWRPAAILLDIGLPSMSGYEVAQALREEPLCKDITIIAVSGWGQADDVARGKLAGFDHHIVKPADTDELV